MQSCIKSFKLTISVSFCKYVYFLYLLEFFCNSAAASLYDIFIIRVEFVLKASANHSKAILLKSPLKPILTPERLPSLCRYISHASLASISQLSLRFS